jgi:enoyl-[acyl-carrier protein] reductase II
MNWATDARLVGAVCEAGALGSIGPNAGLKAPITDAEGVRAHVRTLIGEVRRMTRRPFALNIPIAHGSSEVFTEVMAELAVDERVPVAILVSGSPDLYTARLKAAGVFVIHAVSNVAHARKAQAAGVDAVVAEGFEAGGHSGQAELPLSVLVPQIVDAVALPVVAAGGVVDGRGLVMGLAAGAQAVYMGTRFMAAVESPIHEQVKAAIVQASDVSTIAWGRRVGVARTLANGFARRIRAMEDGGASAEVVHAEIRDYAKAVNRRVGGLLEGDTDEGEIYLGAGAGAIRSVETAAEIIRATMAQAAQVLRTVQQIIGDEVLPRLEP